MTKRLKSTYLAPNKLHTDLKNVLINAVKIVNEIRSRSLKSRLFKHCMKVWIRWVDIFSIQKRNGCQGDEFFRVLLS